MFIVQTKIIKVTISFTSFTPINVSNFVKDISTIDSNNQSVIFS